MWYLLGYNRERDKIENVWGLVVGNKKRIWLIRGYFLGSVGYFV